MSQFTDAIVCPACLSDCKLSFTIADAERTEWIFCKCGSVYHQGQVDKKYFNAEYFKKYTDFKALPERCDYLLRQYLPLVRELTYGRRFLDVGYAFDHYIKALEKDGWIVDGIDILPNGYIAGDFEDHDFKGKQFDFILMSRVLESFHDPIKALYKANELLPKDGVMLIVTPDAELIYEKGMFDFGNWNPEEKSIIFSETQLRKILEMLGFKIILSRKDAQRRGMGWNHAHFLVQKVN